MFKLALKNIISKPLRAVATVLAIAVAVAMIFAMLSFDSAVYEYIYSTQTAVSGSSDILISTNSSSDRIMDVAEPLKKLDGVEEVYPSLTLFALLDGEYVQLRGFEQGEFEKLQALDLVSGSVSSLDANTDNIVISKAAAEHFGLKMNESVELSLGNRSKPFYVYAISENNGYFLNDSPYLIIGRIDGISRLLANVQTNRICNEIYVKAADGVDIDKLIDEISSIPQYSQMLVQRTGDNGYIKEQANSLSAPVILSGAAVFALGIAVIVLLFMMSESEKISLISKYAVIGATKKQIFGIFVTESAILAALGALIGSALAVGVFVGILKLTLSATVMFSISVWKLFGAALIGLVSAIVSSLLPIMRSFKGTIRQNQINVEGRMRLAKIICPIFIVLTILSVIIEFTVPAATAVISVVSLALSLGTLGVSIAIVLRGGAKLMVKLSNPAAKVAAINMKREGRFSRSVTMLGVGMTVSMMLFMAWSMTTSIFSDYTSDFKDLVFVTNIQSGVDTAQFEKVDGVEYATKMVWKQGDLKGSGFDKTMNILGSKSSLNLVDFEYVMPRDEVERLLDSDVSYVFVDVALEKLYGVKVGDKLTLTLEGESRQVIVGGILKHRLFSGNYIVMSEERISELFGIAVDTVVVVADGNTAAAVDALRAKFSNNNYYVVDVLTAYKWDMQSTDAVFDLIGTLAVVVTVFIFAATVAATLIGRAAANKHRTALLNAGMSKRSLLITELIEHSLVAAVAFVLAFAVSVLLTACLIHALRLFGMYFEFMYNAWIVAVVGLAMGIAYAILPVAFNFKKGYTIKKG